MPIPLERRSLRIIKIHHIIYKNTLLLIFQDYIIMHSSGRNQLRYTTRGSDGDEELLEQFTPRQLHKRKKHHVNNRRGSVQTQLRAALNDVALISEDDEDLMYFLNKILNQSEQQFGSSNIEGPDADLFLSDSISQIAEDCITLLEQQGELSDLNHSELNMFYFALLLAFNKLGRFDKGHCAENQANVILNIGLFLMEKQAAKFAEIRRIFDEKDWYGIDNIGMDHRFSVAVPKGHKIFSSDDPNELPNFPPNTIIIDTWAPRGPAIVTLEKADKEFYNYLTTKNLYSMPKKFPTETGTLITRADVENGIRKMDPIKFVRLYNRADETLKSMGYTKEKVLEQVNRRKAAWESSKVKTSAFSARNTTKKYRKEDYMRTGDDTTAGIIERNRPRLYNNLYGINKKQDPEIYRISKLYGNRHLSQADIDKQRAERDGTVPASPSEKWERF